MARDAPAALHRYAWLDSLRALAAYLVVWLHVGLCFENYTPQVHAWGTGWYDLAWSLDVGTWATTLFFIISGFLIPSSLRGPRGAALRKFAVRRFWRLYPAFLLSVVLGAVCCAWIWGDTMPPARWLANLTMVPAWFGQRPVMSPYWTLAVELVFYGVCAAAYALGVLQRPGWLFAVTLLCGCAGPWLLHAPGPEAAAVGVFSVGWMHWGALYRQWFDGAPRLNGRAVLLLFAAAWLMLWPARCFWQGMHTLEPVPLRLGSGYALGLLTWLACSLRYRVEHPRLSWWGEISYSTYLLHTPLYFLTARVLRLSISPGWLSHLPLGVYVMAHLVLITWLAAWSYRWVEKPAIEHAHRLTRASAS